jgi:hypothetical protein
MERLNEFIENHSVIMIKRLRDITLANELKIFKQDRLDFNKTFDILMESARNYKAAVNKRLTDFKIEFDLAKENFLLNKDFPVELKQKLNAITFECN